MARKKARKPPGKIRRGIASTLLKVAPLRRLYTKRLLKTLDESQPHQLPPELRQIQNALTRVPKAQRLATLEASLKQGQQEPPNRALRRAAQKQMRGRRG